MYVVIRLMGMQKPSDVVPKISMGFYLCQATTLRGDSKRQPSLTTSNSSEEYRRDRHSLALNDSHSLYSPCSSEAIPTN